MSAYMSKRIGDSNTHTSKIDESVGVRVRSRRESLGLSPQQLAERLHVDPEEISSYESGIKRIGATRMFELAEALGVSAGHFFGVSRESENVTEVDKRPWAQAGVYLTLPDQGFRLNRAFIDVTDPNIREAIIGLVADLAKSRGVR